ncbi:MAG: cold shock domain-containing protein [Pirellulales bacterium]
MYFGTILSISTDKGFGFIQPAPGGADVFFHCSAVDAEFNSLTIGQTVQYVPDELAEKPRAKSVIVGKEAGPPGNFRAAKPRPPVAEACNFGFVTKLHRGKSEGYISADQGGPEYFFAAADVVGEKKFFELVVGDYVRFVPRANDEEPKRPIAKSVAVAKRPVQAEAFKSRKHPRSLGRKPTWR